MLLEHLSPGDRFQAVEAPEITGTVVKIGEGSATVDLDGRPTVHDFERDGEWIRVKDSGKRRTQITKFLEVRVIK